MFTTIRQILRDESGVTAIEYGLIAALVTVVVIGSLQTIGGSLAGAYQAVANALTGAIGVGG